MEQIISGFSKIHKNILTNLFLGENAKISIKGKRTIEIVFNEGTQKIFIEKSPWGQNVRISFWKIGIFPIYLRNALMFFGNQEEKDFFSKAGLHLIFTNEEELENIFCFLKREYDAFIKEFFIDDTMYEHFHKFAIDKRGEAQKESNKNDSKMAQNILEIVQYSERIRFTKDGSHYLI